MRKIYRFTFENGKAIRTELFCEESKYTSHSAYSVLADTYRHSVLDKNLDKISSGKKYSLYTLNELFTETDYLKMLKEYFEVVIQHDENTIKLYTELLIKHKESLSSVNYSLLKEIK